MLYLKALVDIDDTYDKVHEAMKCRSYQVSIWKSIVPPWKAEYRIGPLTEVGVENWKKAFDETGCKYSAKVFECSES